MVNILLWIISVAILIAILQGSKLLMKFIPSRFLRIQEANHSVTDKAFTWIIGIVGGLTIMAAVLSSSDQFNFGYQIVRNILPFIVIWAALMLLAFICIAIESYITGTYYKKKHGMDKDSYLQMLDKKRRDLALQINREYGQPSAVIDFINDSPYGRGERINAYFFEESEYMLMIKDDTLIDVIPFSAIINYQHDKKERLVRKATARTTTKSSSFGFGDFFFNSWGRSRSKTVFNNAVYEYTYCITLVMDSMKFPEYKMCFGTDYEKFKYMMSLMTIVNHRNKIRPQYKQPPYYRENQDNIQSIPEIEI